MRIEMRRPLHGKAAEFRTLGLFSGIKSFSELERRIEALTDEKQKGDAFEVFAEAYLATQRVGMAKHVWPDKAIPPSIRKRLRLSARDVGADGVIETVSGKCRAYQVKFRSGRAPLTWTETATFFGVTDHCDDRLLFTNSEDVSKVAEQRKDFSSIRGTDLDSLTAEDFDAIRIWLDGRPIVRKKSSPRPYQQRTLDAILQVLNGGPIIGRARLPPSRKRESTARQELRLPEIKDRATAVMACGTGKTFGRC
jgi:predicted helicase